MCERGHDLAPTNSEFYAFRVSNSLAHPLQDTPDRGAEEAPEGETERSGQRKTRLE